MALTTCTLPGKQEKVRKFKIKFMVMKKPGILLYLSNVLEKMYNFEKSNICFKKGGPKKLFVPKKNKLVFIFDLTLVDIEFTF